MDLIDTLSRVEVAQLYLRLDPQSAAAKEVKESILRRDSRDKNFLFFLWCEWLTPDGRPPRWLDDAIWPIDSDDD